MFGGKMYQEDYLRNYIKLNTVVGNMIPGINE